MSSDVASRYGSFGSYRTRRRSRLRRDARRSRVGEALLLFGSLASAAKQAGGRFGAVLADTVSPIGRQRYSRDLLPLPAVTPDTFVLPIQLRTKIEAALIELVNTSVKGLNHLHGGSIGHTRVFCPNPAQMSSLAGIAMRWWQLGVALSMREGPLMYKQEVFTELAARKLGQNASPLVASSVDGLSSSAHVNVVEDLPGELRTVVTDANKLFDCSSERFTPDIAFAGGSLKEYTCLIRSQLRSGKITLSTSCRHAARTFYLPKRSSSMLREVWNGKGLCEATAAAAQPPWLSSPACLAQLESSDDCPVMMSIKDGACFFDQLRVPTEIRKFMGKPYTTARALCEDDGGRHFEDPCRAWSWEELKAVIDDGAGSEFDLDTRLYPLNACWPMGHSWSSMIAQTFMTQRCLDSGLSSNQFLCESNGLPPVGSLAVSVATDDIIAFERGVQVDQIAPFFVQLDAAWKQHGVIEKTSKRVNRATHGEALGMMLLHGKHIMPKPERLYELTCGLIFLLRGGLAAQQSFSTFFGVLQWCMLANRPLLAACQHVYSFLDAESVDIEPIPMQVMSELALISSLMFGFAVDLRATWAPCVWATDGADVFGYGGARASCSPEVARGIISKAHLIDHYVVPCGAGVDEENCIEMPIKTREFKRAFSIRSRRGFHASKLEAGAVGVACRFITRDPRQHRARVAILTDAKAFLFAARKGRSSSPNFANGLRVIAAHSLAVDLRLHFAYVPTRHNPADPASRGIAEGHRRVGKGSNAGERCKRANIFVQQHALKRSLRRAIACGNAPELDTRYSWSSSRSSSCHVQPSI